MATTQTPKQTGIVNNYSVKPRNLTEYTAFRGVTDFTQIRQFDPFETGYSFLSVIAMPKYIKRLAQFNPEIAKMAYSFKHMLEYEFRGLSGIPNIETSSGTISDGINELNMVNRVSMDTSVQVTVGPYYEKSGSLIKKFSEYYLTGIKDRMTQAKTYHGLIRTNNMEPSWENEVFTLLYYVTDNTFLRLERAILLANCQLTSVETSQYDSSKGDINIPEVSITFNAFPIIGYEVDRAANKLLEDITGVTTSDDGSGNIQYHENFVEGTDIGLDSDRGGAINRTAFLDSNDYRYGIMDERSPSGLDNLTEAIKNVNERR